MYLKIGFVLKKSTPNTFKLFMPHEIKNPFLLKSRITYRKFLIHDPRQEVNFGDVVLGRQTRPKSKYKHFILFCNVYPCPKQRKYRIKRAQAKIQKRLIRIKLCYRFRNFSASYFSGFGLYPVWYLWYLARYQPLRYVKLRFFLSKSRYMDVAQPWEKWKMQWVKIPRNNQTHSNLNYTFDKLNIDKWYKFLLQKLTARKDCMNNFMF
uniref:Ribosomal protein S17 n=1 Tax=Chromera velia TaxID=505693 RepID=D9IXF1_9ALVE|nr:ribosomal protein S17 [Chromera velia]ADJ66559.1 ribosomal protein S17 [Chromera velia]